jgi:hypothetical protein
LEESCSRLLSSDQSQSLYSQNKCRISKKRMKYLDQKRSTFDSKGTMSRMMTPARKTWELLSLYPSPLELEESLEPK